MIEHVYPSDSRLIIIIIIEIKRICHKMNMELIYAMSCRLALHSSADRPLPSHFQSNVTKIMAEMTTKHTLHELH